MELLIYLDNTIIKTADFTISKTTAIHDDGTPEHFVILKNHDGHNKVIVKCLDEVIRNKYYDLIVITIIRHFNYGSSCYINMADIEKQIGVENGEQSN